MNLIRRWINVIVASSRIAAWNFQGKPCEVFEAQVLNRKVVSDCEATANKISVRLESNLTLADVLNGHNCINDFFLVPEKRVCREHQQFEN